MTHGVPGSLKAAFAVLLAALTAGVLLVGDESPGSRPAGGDQDFGGKEATYGAALADPVPYDGRSPAEPAVARERVLVELPRPALGELAGVAAMARAERRAYVASLEDEAQALLSALDARGVKARDVVVYARAWHGFAATVRGNDLRALRSAGVRLRANRRLYPAVSQPVPVRAAAPPPAPADGPRVTLLGGGAADGAGRGYDAVGRDTKPAPADAEAGGQPLVDALARLGAGARVVRVSAMRRAAGFGAPEEFARTDELLDGIEHVVDPDGDGDTSDHDPVALVGVSAPYAGFAQAPEIRAIQGAARLGTLVIAPAGHEGPPTGAFGTIGSPAAAAAAVAVAPLSDPGAVARTTLSVGPATIEGAAVLAGSPPARAVPAAAPVDGAAFAGTDAPQLEGRVAVVRAGANPGAEAAAAAAAGAEAVLLLEPREDRRLPTIPAGRVPVPVLGITGEGARAVLELEPGAPVRTTGLTAGDLTARGRPSPFASRGPAFEVAGKPELARHGSAVGRLGLASGAGIAAAAVAVDAARAGRRHPAALRGELLRATTAVRDAAGRRSALPPAPAVPVDAVDVRREGDATGVELTVGRFERGDPAAGRGTVIVPAARLELTLEEAGRAGRLVERLTPPGGERGVLPGEYAYTLPASLVRDLEPGAYLFRVRAWAPRQKRATVASSRPFEVS